MKVYIHTKRRLVAAFWKSLKCWQVIRITKDGDPFIRQETVCVFETQFKRAITRIRADGAKIPASGWEPMKVSIPAGLKRWRDAITIAWNQTQQQ